MMVLGARSRSSGSRRAGIGGLTDDLLKVVRGAGQDVAGKVGDVGKKIDQATIALKVAVVASVVTAVLSAGLFALARRRS